MDNQAIAERFNILSVEKVALLGTIQELKLELATLRQENRALRVVLEANGVAVPAELAGTLQAAYGTSTMTSGFVANDEDSNGH